MGFEDNWTAIMGSDNAREAAIGDAIHTGTAEWIGRRFTHVHQSLPMLRRSA